ncbi:NAD(P)H-binding protein [Streptomyces sp. WMMC500]|uniref:NAD(P)-dependent oxidoreductase n=1 Tax=Streptomyces sp. WMMC500 TaxID=3015154 RepID=UPI00248B9060|nr:NAD(P)H-binding protein [Streptomyces sp. WMMC500]WBB58092.1 NAD(P)H-binding protein [Streptomyces sp. WMMC500]
MRMRVTVFGATGQIGSRIAAEARARGHEVTAVVRTPRRPGALPPGVSVRTGDAADAAAVAALGAGQDLIVGATRPAPGAEDQLPAMARGLLAGAAASGVRLMLVGGSATLTLPGSGGVAVMDGPDFPAEWLPIARACAVQLAVCRAAGPDADWTYASPPHLILPGERTGRYRLGADELVVDDAGESSISMEDFAVALLDEAEQPKHHRTRFTVGY